jgi:hypothetical protein
VILRVEAEAVLADPGLLADYAARAYQLPDVTLAIDASALDATEVVPKIQAAVAAAGLADDEHADLVLVTGPQDALGAARLAAGVHAALSARLLDELAGR